MPSPAIPQNVADRWRPLSAQEETNAGVFLGDAWTMLKRQLKSLGVDIEAEMASDVDVIAEVVRVQCAAVIRVMKNPDGKRREALDDYSWERDAAQASGLLYFTDDEIGALIPGDSGGRRAFVLDPLADYASRWP